ncbi:MAG: quinone-dependent dihydroorotate dehydrogenase [Pseudomonadota bacterium]
MIARLFPFLRPFLFALEPERAHSLSLWALRHGLTGGKMSAPDDPVLATRLAGLPLPNPIGLAAGFDKNAEVAGAVLGLGFGFAEVGTLTPRPQPGNPRPRLFRLVEDEAVINRLGFNNGGLEAALARLGAQAGRPGVVGVNVGANKDSADRIADYRHGVAAVAPYAAYIAVNISSPNTPGLRALQEKASLERLLAAVVAGRGAHGAPIFLKIAPDLEDEDKAAIAAVVLDAGIDGLIIANTTLARPPSLKSRHRGEVGGLSGKPLLAPSTALLADFHRLTKGRLALIGVGGVASGADAYAKIRAGASAVQLYTALVYHGPGLIAQIKRDLARLLRRDGFACVADAVGAGHR